MCPTCKTTLDQSSAPIADRIRQFISARIAAGDTKSEIKRKLVAQFGPAILAEPSKHGFNLLAWVLPFLALGVGAAALGWLVWRWSRGRGRSPAAADGPPIDPELERRLDDELARFDGCSSAGRVRRVGFDLRRHAVRAAARPRLPVGGLGGRGEPVRRAGDRAPRRACEPAVRPRVHCRLRAARRRRGGDRQCSRQARADRVRRVPADRDRARVHRPAALAGAGGGTGPARPRARIERPAGRCVRRLRRALHRCRARVDPGAGRQRRLDARGASCCSATYSLGLGAAFVLAGVAFAGRWRRSAGFATGTGSSRLPAAATLVALGLLLFFDRSWWLNVAVNRVLEKVGLDQI